MRVLGFKSAALQPTLPRVRLWFISEFNGPPVGTGKRGVQMVAVVFRSYLTANEPECIQNLLGLGFIM